MDTAVFYEVVVPLLELDKTALICISTILDSFNFYSKLLELKDENGDPFFVQHTFVMNQVIDELRSPASSSNRSSVVRRIQPGIE